MKSESYYNRTAHRTIEIFEHLVHQKEGLSLQQIADLLGASKSSVYPILRTLVSLGYVEPQEPHGYVLTAKSALLSRAGTKQWNLALALREAVISVGGITADTAVVAILAGSEVISVAEHQSDTSVARLSVPVGTRLPKHATAAGKMLLSGLSNEAVHLLLRTPELPQFTDKTITNLAEFLDELDMIRQQGWAEVWSELNQGVVGVAAPIESPQLGLVGAIELVMPVHHADPEHWAIARTQVVSLARAIASRLASVN